MHFKLIDCQRNISTLHAKSKPKFLCHCYLPIILPQPPIDPTSIIKIILHSSIYIEDINFVLPPLMTRTQYHKLKHNPWSLPFEKAGHDYRLS